MLFINAYLELINDIIIKITYRGFDKKIILYF
jgi:hypothetical protein